MTSWERGRGIRWRISRRLSRRCEGCNVTGIDEVSDRRKQFSLAPVGDDLGTRHRNKICETVIILIPLCSGRYVCIRNAHAHAQSDAIAPCNVTVLIGRALCRMIQSRYIPYRLVRSRSTDGINTLSKVPVRASLPTSRTERSVRLSSSSGIRRTSYRQHSIQLLMISVHSIIYGGICKPCAH